MQVVSTRWTMKALDIVIKAVCSLPLAAPHLRHWVRRSHKFPRIG